MSDIMMLAKQYTPKSLHFPVYVTEKLDGVPVDIAFEQKMSGQRISFTSRQGKPITCLDHIRDVLYNRAVVQGGTHIVGELYIPGVDFKDISGKARQAKKQSPDLQLWVWDMYFEDAPHLEYSERIAAAGDLVRGINNPLIQIIPARRKDSQEALDEYIKTFMASNPNAEGVVIRNGNGLYQLKRSYDMQKYKVTNTADLKIVSFEEAIDAKTSKPLGMVGRINCLYRGEVIGVGPGTMDHPTRKVVWNAKQEYVGKIIEVKYMPDESYDALREARFFRWRDDKAVGE